MIMASPKKQCLSILVVDDYLDNAESMAMVLRLDGHKVTIAFDGESALAIAEDEQPQVVLCDISMPKMAGYEVARQLRRRYGDELLLVAISAYGCSEDRSLSEDAGFDYHLVKPADPREVQHLLQNFSGSM